MDNNFVELVLTSGSWQEAQAIADELLAKQLVACVEFYEIKSKYWWHNKIEKAKEVKLIMQTASTKFSEIQEIVNRLHSYEMPILGAMPVQYVSLAAKKWLKEQVG